MKQRNYAGSKAIGNFIDLLTYLAFMCIILGLILLFVAFSHKTFSIFIGLYIALSCIPCFVLKVFLRGFESMVIASEMYIEHMEIAEEKAKAETKTE